MPARRRRRDGERRPRGPKGTGRVQTTTRANTAKRKEKALLHNNPWQLLDKEEVLGIAQGIMCDKSINYLEYPYFEAAKSMAGPERRAKITAREGKLKHKYVPQPSADWDNKVYKPYKKKQSRNAEIIAMTERLGAEARRRQAERDGLL